MKEKNEYTTKEARQKQAREDRRIEMRREKIKKKMVRFSITFIILCVIVYGIIVLVRMSGPQGEDFSTAYPNQGRNHIAVGEESKSYNSNPPSSGDHYGQTARGGFYDEPLADETVIHNLEHGDIWITYHPRVNNEATSILKKFAGQYVVVSPRPDNDGDISLVAWGRVDTFDIENDAVDEHRIQDFISRYDNRGPEKVRGQQVGHGGF